MTGGGLGGLRADRWLERGIVLAWLGALTALGTAFHEWLYHQGHHAAPGPSLALAIGFTAVALVGSAAALTGHALARHFERYERHLAAEWGQASELRLALATTQREIANVRIAAGTNEEIRDMLDFIEEADRNPEPGEI